LLALRESARGAFSHDLCLYIFISIFFHAKNKSGRAEPVGAANSAISAARSAALTQKSAGAVSDWLDCFVGISI
jgi:hypothetical protein